MSLMLAPHVMNERPAAPFIGGCHDLDALAIEQADGRVVDMRAQHLIGAAGQHRDAALAFAFGRMDGAPFMRRGRRLRREAAAWPPAA